MKRFQTKKHIFNFIIALCLAVAISLCSCPAFDVLATDGEDYEEETEELSDEERAAQERKANIKITCMGKNYPETGSDAIVVMDAATGQVLFDKDAYSRHYPASITKLMTAYLAVTMGDLDSTVTMSYDAVWDTPRDSSHIALDVDEQLSLRDALYATLLVSANEAAYAVAEHIGGSLPEFVELMNNTAAGFGCKDTHFANASGLHDDNHYTTAYDMALIVRGALKNDTFREFTSTKFHEIAPTNKNDESRPLWQDNKLIMEDYDVYYEACEGGKTGYTDEAQNTLATWAKKGDRELICIVLYSDVFSNKYKDTTGLYDYFFDYYSYAQPFKDYTFDGEMVTLASDTLCKYYDCNNAGYMHLEIDKNMKRLLPTSIDKKLLKYDFTPSTDRVDDDIIGTLTCTYNDAPVAEQPVYFSGFVKSNDEEAVEEAKENETINPAYGVTKKKNHTVLFIIIGVLVLSVLALTLRYFYVQKVMRDRRRRRRR
ncbi:MAG: D-alanyl-D-alanine carboxypeptidase [Lachnospiraceae bacterium]|nr:D-alanyl-D-alanine carboxypeptidase [Lachnospiraceae bacterium]